MIVPLIPGIWITGVVSWLLDSSVWGVPGAAPAGAAAGEAGAAAEGEGEAGAAAEGEGETGAAAEEVGVGLGEAGAAAEEDGAGATTVGVGIVAVAGTVLWSWPDDAGGGIWGLDTTEDVTSLAGTGVTMTVELVTIVVVFSSGKGAPGCGTGTVFFVEGEGAGAGMTGTVLRMMVVVRRPSAPVDEPL